MPHPIQETYPHRAIVQERIRIGLPSAVMAGDVPDASDDPGWWPTMPATCRIFTFHRASDYRTRVSVPRNGILSGRDRRPETAPWTKAARSRDAAGEKKPASGGHLRHLRKSLRPDDCVVGPGGVPTSNDFNALICPTCL